MNTVPPNYNLLIAKKTEKIVTAIYLVSQFLKDTESLKDELRSVSNDLLKSLNLLAYGDHKEIFSIYKNSLDSVSLLISYLTIAKESNLISRMNTEIVIEALRVLENLLNKKQFILRKDHLFINEENFLNSLLEGKEENTINTNTSYDVLTGRNTFENNFSIQTKNEIVKNSFIKDKIYKGQTKDINDKIIEREPIKAKVDIKDILGTSSPKSESKSKKSAQNKERKNSRREQILGLFSKGVEVSIKDISKKIVGCSVKTIQRELNDLVFENKIERIGDKRWSKYTLAK